MAQGGQDSNLPTTTSPPVTQTTTTTTTSAQLPPLATNSIIGRPTGLRTSADVRVSWVYTIQKPQLIQECQIRNLDSSGRSDDLRARLVAHLRTPTDECHNYKTAVHPDGYQSETSLNTGTIPKINRNRPQTESDESQVVREIIGLAPDMDLCTLTQRLVTLMHKEKLLDRETYLYTHPPVSPSANEWTSTFPIQPAARTRNVPGVEVPLRTEETTTTQPHSRPTGPWDLNLPRHTQEHEDRSYVTPASAMRNYSGISIPHEATSRDDRSVPPTTASLCDIVRKWNLKFEDKEDPISFLERLTELLEAYEIPVDRILRALPEIFKGNALLWWRNNHALWRNYREFIRDFENQFLPPGYYRNLDREIQERTQGEQEPCRSFVVAISTLIRRRGGFSEAAGLERMYQNLKPEYKFYIRRHEVRTVSDLVTKAEEYEALLRDKSTYRTPPGPAQAFTPSTAYHSRSRKRVDFSEPVYLDIIHQSPLPRTPPQTSTREAPRGFQKNLANAQNRDRERSPSPHPRQTPNTTTLISHPNHRSRSPSPGPRPPFTCWNCEREGHVARECPQPRRVRCFYCKKEGCLTVNCNCRSGNGQPALRTGSQESRSRQ